MCGEFWVRLDRLAVIRIILEYVQTHAIWAVRRERTDDHSYLCGLFCFDGTGHHGTVQIQPPWVREEKECKPTVVWRSVFSAGAPPLRVETCGQWILIVKRETGEFACLDIRAITNPTAVLTWHVVERPRMSASVGIAGTCDAIWVADSGGKIDIASDVYRLNPSTMQWSKDLPMPRPTCNNTLTFIPAGMTSRSDKRPPEGKSTLVTTPDVCGHLVQGGLLLVGGFVMDELLHHHPFPISGIRDCFYAPIVSSVDRRVVTQHLSTWHRMPSLCFARASHTAHLFQDTVVVIGGCVDVWKGDNLDRFMPVTSVEVLTLSADGIEAGWQAVSVLPEDELQSVTHTSWSLLQDNGQLLAAPVVPELVDPCPIPLLSLTPVISRLRAKAEAGAKTEAIGAISSDADTNTQPSNVTTSTTSWHGWDGWIVPEHSVCSRTLVSLPLIDGDPPLQPTSAPANGIHR